MHAIVLVQHELDFSFGRYLLKGLALPPRSRLVRCVSAEPAREKGVLAPHSRCEQIVKDPQPPVLCCQEFDVES